MVQKVLVLGATGNQRGATLRHLGKAGVAVRTLTRKPNGKKAQALAAPEARKMFDWYREPRFNADVPALRAQHPGLQRIGDFFGQLAVTGGV